MGNNWNHRDRIRECIDTITDLTDIRYRAALRNGQKDALGRLNFQLEYGVGNISAPRQTGHTSALINILKKEDDVIMLESLASKTNHLKQDNPDLKDRIYHYDSFNIDAIKGKDISVVYVDNGNAVTRCSTFSGNEDGFGKYAKEQYKRIIEVCSEVENTICIFVGL